MLIKEKYPECECLMGTATAGIAHAALVGDILELPMGYVRGGAKSHGRNNRIDQGKSAQTHWAILEKMGVFLLEFYWRFFFGMC